jgi:hypothetical protein
MVPEGVTFAGDAGKVYPVGDIAKADLDVDAKAALDHYRIARRHRLEWAKTEETAKGVLHVHGVGGSMWAGEPVVEVGQALPGAQRPRQHDHRTSWTSSTWSRPAAEGPRAMTVPDGEPIASCSAMDEASDDPWCRSTTSTPRTSGRIDPGPVHHRLRARGPGRDPRHRTGRHARHHRGGQRPELRHPLFTLNSIVAMCASLHKCSTLGAWSERMGFVLGVVAFIERPRRSLDPGTD